MNNSGLVSIIMPNYNGERFLEETINSVLNQTYGNFELIIVDDCSTDNSVELIKSFVEKDGRIKLLSNEKNSGAAAARNRALREAKGKWIAFLDSDDLWLEEKLEKQIGFMIENDCSFSYTRYRQIDENSNSLDTEVVGPCNLDKRMLSRCCYPGCLTVMYDAEEVGLVQIPDEIANGENDYAMWLKIIKKFNCWYIDEVLALYRIVQSSLSHKSSKWKIIKNHYKMYRLSEKKNVVSAFFKTLKNVLYTYSKKKRYVRRIAGE